MSIKVVYLAKNKNKKKTRAQKFETLYLFQEVSCYPPGKGIWFHWLTYYICRNAEKSQRATSENCHLEKQIEQRITFYFKHTRKTYPAILYLIKICDVSNIGPRDAYKVWLVLQRSHPFLRTLMYWHKIQATGEPEKLRAQRGRPWNTHCTASFTACGGHFTNTHKRPRQSRNELQDDTGNYTWGLYPGSTLYPFHLLCRLLLKLNSLACQWLETWKNGH